MVGPNQPSIEMATVSELLDIQVERAIVAPPDILEEAETGIFEAESEDSECDINAFDGDVEVNDIKPLPLLTLGEARICASRLLEFMVVNNKFVKKAGPSSKRDYPRDLYVLVQVLGSMNETSRSRQASILNWFVSGSSAGSFD